MATHTTAEYMRRWRKQNPKAAKAIDRRNRENNSKAIAKRKAAHHVANRERVLAKMHDNHIRRTYGITAAQYSELLAKQGGVCVICQRPPTLRRLSVDHDHKTKKVRGLLCVRCNRGIGLFWDDLEVLARVVAYLREFVD